MVVVAQADEGVGCGMDSFIPGCGFIRGGTGG